jgi:hypothetical protein
MSRRSLRREIVAWGLVVALSLVATLAIAHGCAPDRADALARAASAPPR